MIARWRRASRASTRGTRDAHGRVGGKQRKRVIAKNASIDTGENRSSIFVAQPTKSRIATIRNQLNSTLRTKVGQLEWRCQFPGNVKEKRSNDRMK